MFDADSLAAGMPFSTLQRATREMSEAYREHGRFRLQSPAHYAAYAITRMPATLAVCRRVLSEIDITGKEAVDLGAGPGTAAIAAMEAGAISAECVEADFGMIQLGAKFVPEGVRWRQTRFESWTAPKRVGVAICSYSLGEAAPLENALRIWEAAETLVVIEPGTPAGFASIRAIRDALTEFVAAPCPQRGPCPMTGEDWCHSAVRIARSSLHRRLKDGEQGHEDEKYAYVILSRTPAELATARIMRHPLYRPGLVELQLCKADGAVHKRKIVRSSGALYRAARKASWGDRWGDLS